MNNLEPKLTARENILDQVTRTGRFIWTINSSLAADLAKTTAEDLETLADANVEYLRSMISHPYPAGILEANWQLAFSLMNTVHAGLTKRAIVLEEAALRARYTMGDMIATTSREMVEDAAEVATSAPNDHIDAELGKAA